MNEIMILHSIKERVKTIEYIDLTLDILKDLIIGLSIPFILNKIKKWNKRNNKKKPCYDLEKNYMLVNICRLYEIPNFTIDNPTMNRDLIKIFYELSIELLLRFNIKEENRMRYIASNYSVCTNDLNSLIVALQKELRSPDRHDARYRLGFRSIYVLLSDNLEKIDKDELKTVLERLRPFFMHYKHQDLLNHYAA